MPNPPSDINHPSQIHHWYHSHFLTNFLAGGTSAAIAVTVFAPLERIKLLLQVQKSARNISRQTEYKGIIDCFIRIPREQGYLSFWRGNLASVIRCFPYQALNFSLKDKFKEKFQTWGDMTKFSQRLVSNLMSGGLAGATALAIIYPLDYARTRLAVDTGTGNKREFKTIRHTMYYTYKKDGLKGLYRGIYFSVLGVFFYRAVYFGTYDTGMEILSHEYRHTFWVQFLIAEIASVFGSAGSYPLDTVRRSMMMQSGRDKKLYNNSIECYRTIYAKYGLRGFYHGLLVNVLRGSGGALVLVSYDTFQSYMQDLENATQDVNEPASEFNTTRPTPSGLISKNSKKPRDLYNYCHFN